MHGKGNHLQGGGPYAWKRGTIFRVGDHMHGIGNHLPGKGPYAWKGNHRQDEEFICYQLGVAGAMCGGGTMQEERTICMECRTIVRVRGPYAWKGELSAG